MMQCDKCRKPIDVGDDVYILSAAYVTDSHDYERCADVALWCYTCGKEA